MDMSSSRGMEENHSCLSHGFEHTHCRGLIQEQMGDRESGSVVGGAYDDRAAGCSSDGSSV